MKDAATTSSPKFTVSAVVLAAGCGSRFSGNMHKLATEIDGIPMIRRTVMNCLAADFAMTVTVTGAETERLARLISDLPVPAIYNPNWAKGQFSSLICGLSYLIAYGVGSNTSVCFALADQPFVKVETYNELIHTAALHQDKIIVPRYRAIRGNPTVFPARLFDEMLNAPVDDTGGRRWLTPENIFYLDVDDPGVRKDIDRISDLD